MVDVVLCLVVARFLMSFPWVSRKTSDFYLEHFVIYQFTDAVLFGNKVFLGGPRLVTPV